MDFTIQRQLSIAIENKPGRLAAIGRLMAGCGVNIKDICVVDNVEQGMIRLITSDPAACKAQLASEGHVALEADVIVLILKDRPGQLEAVGSALNQAGINIDYAYGSEDAREEELRLIIKVSNLKKAAEVLSSLEA
ncbi:ACT domain-containing protein [Methylocaldum marinum]|uniref:ACT domain-containing protein n=1 Tax=Methylocaldum marinum TaxID=1432792 RepID=A0A250KVL2_9GAMM|nr:ACT domain-containing protein [Methylocaldum marinum]BBA35622.1 ACT domain-containing protein [Methylocaldum marinum]